MIQAGIAMQAGFAQERAVPVRMARKAKPAAKRRTRVKTEPIFRTTFSTVELDARRLTPDIAGLTVPVLVEALRLARSEERSELLLCDIAPGVPVGDARVVECQERLEALIKEAVLALCESPPEMRLSLRGSTYDLRCYLGRRKPSDFIYDFDI